MAGTRGGVGRIAGTRGGVGRIAAMAIGLAVVLVLVLADAARAGNYNVAQCGWGVGTELDLTVPRAEGDAFYLIPSYCTSPPAGVPAGIAFEAGYAADGDQGIARARWVAPPGTGFAAVRFTWGGELAPGFWYVAGAGDTGYNPLAFNVGSSAPSQVAAPIEPPARVFEVRFECLLLGPVFGCERSARSTMRMGAVTLTVADPVPPLARMGGALVGPGWHRGTLPLEATAEDAVGAGVADEEATIDGAPVLAAPQACAVATIEGEVRATRMRPCPATAARTVEVDTTGLADGEHTLRGCATDFSGGRGCAPDVRIQVDNSAPEVDFGAAPEGQVAATVSDPFSGPAAGTIAVRRADSEAWVDLPTTFDGGGAGTATLSAQLPDLSAGAYFFRATASDGAGNSAAAQFRAAGGPADLRHQVATAGAGSGPASRGGGRSPGAHGRATHLVAYLAKGGGRARVDRSRAGPGPAGAGLAGRGFLRPGSDRSSLTVDYGTAVEVRGRLTDAHGTAVAGRPVAVVARSAAGSGSAPERRRVVTDHSGRFELRLPPGTSCRVGVSFHGGGGLAPARARSLALRVRAAVSLTATPHRLETGDSVALSGRVRPGPARIPARGKLVTVQYLERSSGRWRPALVVRTGARGRFKARYLFRYITGDARIRLRATALPEAAWPYAAGSSAPVTVEVRGR
jgi:hypothetical protein